MNLNELISLLHECQCEVDIYNDTVCAEGEKDAVLRSSPRRRASPARARGCQPPLFFKPAQCVDEEKDAQEKKRILWSKGPD